MAHHTQDDGFHEIQLNGKQLVFLFMAATVVSVVIFLCGVLVGRGVRAERGAIADTAALSETPTAAVQDVQSSAPGATSAAAAPAGSDPTAAAPPAPADDLSYFKRLEQQNPPPEELKPVPDKAATPARDQKSAAAQAPQGSQASQGSQGSQASQASTTVAHPTPAAKAPVAASPAGEGYVVQVAALNARSEALAYAKRLTTKGYPAFVTEPAAGAPAFYRVRVGSFKTRREADSIADKLRKEEQLKPFVTQG